MAFTLTGNNAEVRERSYSLANVTTLANDTEIDNYALCENR